VAINDHVQIAVLFSRFDARVRGGIVKL